MRRSLIIGLTGGIGVGKSTLALQLAALGGKICNADTVVHRLLAKGGKAVAAVEKLFPGAVKNGAVDRKALGDIVFHDEAKMKQLERLLHPLVVAEETRFARKNARLGAKLIVLDIPLLFETGAEKRFDKIMVASAPPFLQEMRVLKRPGMTKDTFRRIIAKQMREREKQRRADVVILTGLGKAHSFRQIKAWVRHETRNHS